MRAFKKYQEYDAVRYFGNMVLMKKRAPKREPFYAVVWSGCLENQLDYVSILEAGNRETIISFLQERIKTLTGTVSEDDYYLNAFKSFEKFFNLGGSDAKSRI